MDYKTIANDGIVEEEIKKSRFICHLKRISREEEGREYIAQIKKQHHKANHSCSAIIVGDDGQIKRSSDDGEPSGTAGRPILATIEGNELTNVLVLVNRWFGGVKLGTGGLVRAYGGCAGQCLILAEKIELIEKKQVIFSCYFNEWPILQYELKHQQMEYTENYTAEGVIVEAALQIHQIDPLKLKLQDITRGREQLKIVEPEHE